jgi:hypothetical protein
MKRRLPQNLRRRDAFVNAGLCTVHRFEGSGSDGPGWPNPAGRTCCEGRELCSQRPPVSLCAGTDGIDMSQSRKVARGNCEYCCKNHKIIEQGRQKKQARQVSRDGKVQIMFHDATQEATIIHNDWTST